MIEDGRRMNDESAAAEPGGSEHPGPVEEAKGDCRRELDEVKREFDAFLYTVSHDLGAPLRAIQGFSRLLLDQYGERLDGKGRDYLERMQEASRKMDQMIDELLQVSRLGKAGMKSEDVDLSGIARRILDRLAKSAPERGVKCVVADNVRALGDEALLTIVLKNLLSNAWKSTWKMEGAVIEFGVDLDGEMPVYFVRDNGLGFSMIQAAHRLFKPFQKLHDELEFPGVGIGLAKVSRIIRRSGGTVWAEGEKEKGATFFFTLR